MQIPADTAPTPPQRRTRIAPVRPVQHPAGRAAELRTALLRTLRLGRRPTTLEDTEIARVVRLHILAEEAGSASPHIRLRAEALADAALRRLLGGRVKAMEAAHGVR